MNNELTVQFLLDYLIIINFPVAKTVRGLEM